MTGERDIFRRAALMALPFCYLLLSCAALSRMQRRTFTAWRFVVGIVAVLLMRGGVGGIFYGVFKGTIALSVRTLQFLAIAMVVPAILILSLERSIGNESTAALLGAIVGYVLAGAVKNE